MLKWKFLFQLNSFESLTYKMLMFSMFFLQTTIVRLYMKFIRLNINVADLHIYTVKIYEFFVCGVYAIGVLLVWEAGFVTGFEIVRQFISVLLWIKSNAYICFNLCNILIKSIYGSRHWQRHKFIHSDWSNANHHWLVNSFS